jgi:hypothetical protein
MPAPTSFTCTVNGPNLSGSRVLNASKVVTGNAEVGEIIAVPQATDGQVVAIAFAFATIKLAYLLATTDMTVFTNVDGGAANDTIVLKAGVPCYYIQGSGTNPFAHNVTQIFIDNLGAAAGQLDIYVLSQLA